MEESREIRVMRNMAWERAKGELESILCTYYGNDNYDKFEEKLNEFVKYIEDWGIQE